MAVMRNSIIFGGVDSADFGIYIGGEGTFNAPKRDVEMISIPGRNGAFALDKGRFQNIEVTYSAFNHEPDLATFSAQLEGFRNAICSQKGYQRLTDTFHPDEYRMAAYVDGLEIKPIDYNTASTFDITFDCKPQRYLTSGEEPVTIGEWHETETASGTIASFEAKDGDAVKSLLADIEPIQDLHGYDKPWSGGNGKNKLNNQGTSGTVAGVTYTVNSDGSVSTSGTSTGWNGFSLGSQTLPAGTYIMSSGVGATQVYYKFLSASINGTTYETNNGDVTFTLTEQTTFTVNLLTRPSYAQEVKFYPMIRLSTVSDATYEPYANICPISGYDSVVVSRTGKNLLDGDTFTSKTTKQRCSVTAKDDYYAVTVTANTGAVYIGNTTAVGSVIPTSDYYGADAKKGQTFVASGAEQITFYEVDANRTVLSATTKNSGQPYTVTNDDCVALTFRFILSNSAQTIGTVFDFKPQLELGSTATAYEPYNGNTYTIDLNGTRYGGTLDVASGMLTVDGVSVDLGSLTWEVWPGYTSIFRCGLPSDCKTVGNQGVPNWLCSAYAVTSGVSVSSTIGSIGQLHASYVLANNPSYTDASAFKTAMTGQTLVYELATPLTVQLTAQEVELLVGLNNIWANSGDVSVEYGTAPNILINPTLFESSPMLEVWGHGDIGFNGYGITINDVIVGDIETSTKSSPSIPEQSAPFTNSKTIDYSAQSGAVNAGDSLFISSIKTTVVARYLDFVGATPSPTITSDVGTPSVSATVYNYQSSSPLTILWARYTLNAAISDIELTAFTDETHTATVTLPIRDTSNVLYYTEVITVTITNTESGVLTISVTYGGEDARYGNPIYTVSLEYGRTYLYSTKSILGSPLYVDCDLGEAYKYEGETIVSINQHVDLGSDLPKLGTDANEITHSDTITALKVAPRWWKI